MKIGILSRWNATCGVSLHAELLGRELLRRGYVVKVFAPFLSSANKWWHHKIIRPDEVYVRRVYTETSPEGSEGSLEKKKLLAEKLDLLLVESYEKIPYKDVEELAKVLKDKGIPSIAVVHEGAYEDIGYTDMSAFEAVVVFDERYIKEVLKERVEQTKVHVIPYPCHPVREGKRKFMEDGKITFFTFGRQPKEEYKEYIEALRALSEEFENIRYRIVRADELLEVSYNWVVQERKVLDLEEIYQYLHGSDFHLLPKGRTRRVVVSSTLCQVLGALCTTVAPKSRFFESLPQGEGTPVVLYDNVEDLVVKLKRLISDGRLRERIKENAREYVEENSVGMIADRFENLIHKSLAGGRK